MSKSRTMRPRLKITGIILYALGTTPSVLQFCWKTWKQSQEGVYQDGVPFLSPSLIVSPQSRREEETHSFLAWRKQETHRQRWTSGFRLHTAQLVFIIPYRKHTDIVQYCYCTHPIYHGCRHVWPGLPPLWEIHVDNGQFIDYVMNS